MKLLFSIVILVLSILALWQAQVLHDLGIRKKTADRERALLKSSGNNQTALSKRFLPPWNSLPPTLRTALDEWPLSPTSQQRAFQEILGLPDQAARAVAIARWAESHTTTEQLQGAMNALQAAPEADQEVLFQTFGPALLSQWGLVDPKNGFQVWASLDTRNKLWLSDVGFSVKNSAKAGEVRLANEDPLPAPGPLIDAWASNDPESLFSAIVNNTSFFDSEEITALGISVDYHDIVGRFFAQEDPETIIRRFDQQAKLSQKGSPIIPDYTLVHLLSNRIIRSEGGLEAAVETASLLPQTELQEKVVLDMKTSHTLREGLRLSEAGNDDAFRDLLDRFYASAAEASREGRSQIASTLLSEVRSHFHLLPELTPYLDYTWEPSSPVDE